MLWVEAFAAALLGLGALWLVLRPLVHPDHRENSVFEPADPEETPKGIALAALKEIEFDRETGKLSDADYEALKAKYTASALDALRQEERKLQRQVTTVSPPETEGSSTLARATCQICGPRPEPDAVFCSNCGRPLTRQVAA
jgi:hypothetical protein